MSHYRWVVDKEHTQIRFHNRHLTIVMVSGTFTDFDIRIEGRDFSRIEVRIPVASLDTEHIQRDEHLKSPDFLDAQHHPYITFV
ncbi:MAG: YceI family protein, partial [Bacteroidia bacterium]|nr:YceI family protein [Bacteroidia bacterium]MDW8335110.1 YceI family protein [Bacteroidia bacterium]